MSITRTLATLRACQVGEIWRVRRDDPVDIEHAQRTAALAAAYHAVPPTDPQAGVALGWLRECVHAAGSDSTGR
jgi:hypothetical protein